MFAGLPTAKVSLSPIPQSKNQLIVSKKKYYVKLRIKYLILDFPNFLFWKVSIQMKIFDG